MTWEDVKFACNKGKIWTFTEKEAMYVLFYIRCEVFKIYSKEWETWVKTWGVKADEPIEEVIINY